MNFQILTQTHFLDCKKLLAEDHNDYPPPGKLRLENYYFNDAEGAFKVFGLYDDHGILLACVFGVFSTYDRTWVIEYVARQPFAKTSDLIKTLEFALATAASGNYYRLLVMYLDDSDSTWEKMFARKSVHASEYNINIEEVIQPHKRSSFDRYWTWMQRRTCYACTIKIKEYSMKAQYRVFIDK